jgi:hypothetical protein
MTSRLRIVIYHCNYRFTIDSKNTVTCQDTGFFGRAVLLNHSDYQVMYRYSGHGLLSDMYSYRDFEQQKQRGKQK